MVHADISVLQVYACCPCLHTMLQNTKRLLRVSAGLALIALNPVIVYLVAQIAWSLAWRLQWLLPVAGTVALGIFLVADFIARGKPTLRLLLCALGLIGFAMLGQTTFYKHNRNAIGIPQIKPPPTVNGVFERHHNGRYKLHAGIPPGKRAYLHVERMLLSASTTPL